MANPDEQGRIRRVNGGGRRARPRWTTGAGVSHLAAVLQERCEDLLGRNAVWSVVAVVVLPLFLSQQQCGLPMPVHDAGDVARATVRATTDIELPDEAATRARRAAEGARISPVFDHLVNLPQVQAARLGDLFATGRSLLQAAAKGSSGAQAAGLERLAEALPYPLPREAVTHLAAGAMTP